MANQNSWRLPSRLRRTALATLLLTAFGLAQAEDVTPLVQELRQDFATPVNRISVGLGLLSGEPRRQGMFRGQQENGTYGLLDLDLAKRDDATGTWLKLKGRNLGLDHRELRFDHEKQGDWAYFIEAGRTPRQEPLIVNTGLQGVGTTRQTVSSTAQKRDLNLKMERELVSLGARKFVLGDLDVRINFKQEEKRGDRMYGRGGAAHEFFLEPLDRTVRQWDVLASYADKTLQLSGGYSGSTFDNSMPFVDVVGGAAGFAATATNPFQAQSRFALPLSNQAHQLHLSGGYNFSATTRSSFRLSRSVATQNETLVREPGTVPFAGSANSIDGKVVTTLAYADLVLRPAENLDFSASLRFEDRDDQSPYRQYIAAIAPAVTNFGGGVSGFRIPRSLKQIKANIEAGYRLDQNYRLVGSLDHERVSRNVPEPYRRIAYREDTDETQARVELKRALAETLNGGVAWITSNRTGSAYIPDTKASSPANPSFASNQIGALLWADRKRDKLRLTADWLPDEDWSVQAYADLAKDIYSGRNLGPREGSAVILSADAAYRLSDTWQMNAWASYGRTRARQQTRSDPDQPGTHNSTLYNSANENVYWQADLRDITKAFGVGIKGKPSENLELGGDIMSSSDTAVHGMEVLSGSPVNFDALPDYFYRLLSLRLYADYGLDRYSGVRFSLLHEQRKTNDWTWTNYIYGPAVVNSDGTTVRDISTQNSTFVGVAYHHRWR